MGEEPGTDYTYNCKLGIWLNGQRRLKKGTHGNTRLAPEREMLLQELVDQGKPVVCRLTWFAVAKMMSDSC